MSHDTRIRYVIGGEALTAFARSADIFSFRIYLIANGFDATLPPVFSYEFHYP